MEGRRAAQAPGAAMQRAARRRGSRRDEQGLAGSRGPSRDAGTQGRRDAGTQGRRIGSSLCSTCQEVKRETQERVLMLRPVRPCVPVSAGMGCARSPLQSGRASWTVLCRSPERNASTRDCPACCCACRRRTAPFPRHCWRLLTALPFVVRGDITHQVIDALFVAANSKLRGGGGGGGGVDGAVHAAAGPRLLRPRWRSRPAHRVGRCSPRPSIWRRCAG